MEAFMNGSPHNPQPEYGSGPYQFVALPVYRSGETAQETGIFTVVHPHEKESSEVLIVRGTRLPYCPACNHALAFCLEREAAHIGEDADFARPKVDGVGLSRRERRRRKKERQKISREMYDSRLLNLY
jgi:hypothetical protein